MEKKTQEQEKIDLFKLINRVPLWQVLLFGFIFGIASVFWEKIFDLFK